MPLTVSVASRGGQDRLEGRGAGAGDAWRAPLRSAPPRRPSASRTRLQCTTRAPTRLRKGSFRSSEEERGGGGHCVRPLAALRRGVPGGMPPGFETCRHIDAPAAVPRSPCSRCWGYAGAHAHRAVARRRPQGHRAAERQPRHAALQRQGDRGAGGTPHPREDGAGRACRPCWTAAWVCLHRRQRRRCRAPSNAPPSPPATPAPLSCRPPAGLQVYSAARFEPGQWVRIFVNDASTAGGLRRGRLGRLHASLPAGSTPVDAPPQTAAAAAAGEQ